MATVLLGVTGCIAAYKACEIVRGLQKRGHEVKVVMTEHACEFVGPVTFRALTNHEVAVGLFDEAGAPVHHVSLAKEADVFVIAPATANVIAKLAHGQADDLLSTTALACQAPLVVAPAMNCQMYEDVATRENLATLQARGARIVGPASGYLACGDEGAGRMEDPQLIVEETCIALEGSRDMEGMRILITAGPTHEPIDPVRYIGNNSSGLSGYALAAEAASRGANVTLVSGPCALTAPKDVDLVKVITACEMLDACEEPFEDADIAVFVAAVADWHPENFSKDKIKHDGAALDIHLVPNPDIAATLSARKDDTYVVVYAAETGDPIEAAKQKLKAKNADLAVANDVSNPDLGMGSVDNHVWFVDDVGVYEVPTFNKRAIARALLDHIMDCL